MRETAPLPPIKRFLETKGYEVKRRSAVQTPSRGGAAGRPSELNSCFAVAVSSRRATSASQTDVVYIAVPASKGQASHVRFEGT